MEECFQNHSIVMDFSDAGFNTTMKQIEELYWHYIDNYKPVTFCTPYNFLCRLLRSRNISASIDVVKQYWRRYEKYKKMIPTAGTIIKYKEEILLVRVQGSNIYSMPKGKYEATDSSLRDTAIRETLEETGVDLRDAPISEGPNILKTQFFMYEMDTRQDGFTGYNINEITEVSWIQITDIINRPDLFSKQTQQVAEYLLGGPKLVL